MERPEGGLWLEYVQPVEAAGSRRDGGHVGSGQGGRPHRLVLQRQLPVAGHAVLRAHHRAVVLVHGSVHRAAVPRRAQRTGGSARQRVRGVLEAVARVHLHHPGYDVFRAGQDGARGSAARGPLHGGPPGWGQGAGGLPAHGAACAALGRTRDRRGGPAVRADEFAGRRVQRQFDAVHDGPLQEAASAGVGASVGMDGPPWRRARWS